MKTKLILSTVFLLLSLQSFSQAPAWLWAKGTGGTSEDRGLFIAVDDHGNCYSTGYFQGTGDFDPGTGTTTLISAGGNDIFISKTDSAGNFIWAKKIGGADADECHSIATDDSGNVYITGYFNGTVDFDPGAGIFNLTAAGLGGNHDIFVTKLDSSGNFVWGNRFGGTSGGGDGNCIAIDPTGSGDVYVTGFFIGTLDFDPGTATYNLVSNGGEGVFICKLDASGDFIWAKGLIGAGFVQGYSIALDVQGKVYTTGAFDGTVDFNPGTGISNLTAAGSHDLFISKLDSAGNFNWAKRIGSANNNAIGYSIAIDRAGTGDVFTTGYFYGTIDFDPGAGTSNLGASGNDGLFISKLDSSGSFLWANQIGGTVDGGVYGNSIALDLAGSGDIYTSGTFHGDVDFDPGSGVFTLLGNFGKTFISKLNNSGNFIWAKSTDADAINSITSSTSGNVFVTGYFYNPGITFGTTTLINTDVTGSSSDLFIAKLDTALTIGIDNIENANNGILLFPNPSVNHFTISIADNRKITNITITDFTGKLIYSIDKIETEKIELNTNDFYGGIYLVQIASNDFIGTKKLIILK